jgi:hypothetical protein
MVLGRLDRGDRGLGMHVGALSLAPLSVVEALLSGGLVFLAVFAERIFGFRSDATMGRRNDHRGWLAVIGLTGGSPTTRSAPGGTDRRRRAIVAIGAPLGRGVSTRRHALPRSE